MAKEYKKYNIKAIPTVFDGILYRSRLEAKYACFFSLVPSIKFEYEPIDFKGWSPDFKIIVGDLEFYVEVKPNFLHDLSLWRKISNATKTPVLVLPESPFNYNISGGHKIVEPQTNIMVLNHCDKDSMIESLPFLDDFSEYICEGIVLPMPLIINMSKAFIRPYDAFEIDFEINQFQLNELWKEANNTNRFTVKNK